MSEASKMHLSTHYRSLELAFASAVSDTTRNSVKFQPEALPGPSHLSFCDLAVPMRLSGQSRCEGIRDFGRDGLCIIAILSPILG